MQTVEAFHCAYCAKIYLSEETCQKHEKRCSLNPKTRSCASCVCERFKNYRIMSGHTKSIHTCLRNHDISAKLKTSCWDHLYKKAKCEIALIKEIKANYNPKSIVTPILERYREEINKKMEAQRQLNEQGSLLCADATIGRIASAVGWTLITKGIVDLANENDALVKDDFLKRGFESQMSEVEDVAFTFDCMRIGRERAQGVIDNMAKNLPGNPIYSLSLIQQGYREYHQKMAAFAELRKNNEFLEFHRARLESFGDWKVTGMAGKLIYYGSPNFYEEIPDLDSLKIFLDRLEKIDPDLRKDITEAMRRPW